MTSNDYELQRDSRIMCYIPASEGLGGGHLFTPIELCLDEVSDEYFEKIKALVDVIDAKNFARDRFDDLISGDFRWHVEIGPKGTKPQDLKTIFGSQVYEIIPSELLQLQKLLMDAIRDAQGRPVMPEPTYRDIGLA
ncbi:MAG: hypothetical protein ACLFR0_02470 [Alphaproteobacteria bacterium]